MLKPCVLDLRYEVRVVFAEMRVNTTLVPRNEESNVRWYSQTFKKNFGFCVNLFLSFHFNEYLEVDIDIWQRRQSFLIFLLVRPDDDCRYMIQRYSSESETQPQLFGPLVESKIRLLFWRGNCELHVQGHCRTVPEMIDTCFWQVL